MTPELQRSLIDRINEHRNAARSTDTAPSSMSVPVTTFTDHDRFERERGLLATRPILVGLSGLLPDLNSYATIEVGGRSVVLTRGPDGIVSGMLNVCAHRGAEVAAGCGSAARLTCPYHGWTFTLDGELAARRRSEFFDDVPERGMTQLPVLERNGLIWVSATPGASIDDDLLGGVAEEVAPLELASYRLFETADFERPMNWKQPVETFAETYHLATLHRASLDPWLFSDNSLYDSLGRHCRMIAVRRSIEELDTVDRDDWNLLPHATVIWFMQPNTVLIHQRDHIEICRSSPGGTPDTTKLSVSLYVPTDCAEPDEYWEKNFRILLDVTDTEDFNTAAGVQRGFYSGAHDTIAIGRNEPALQHYHRELDRLLDEMSA